VILHAPWKAGPAAPGGPVFVSLTVYTAKRHIDLPGIYLAALGLRRSWPGMGGAVGLLLWSDVVARRAGSVSVWRSEEDLMAFVRWAPHLEIMRRYRERGSLVSESWHSEGPDRSHIWSEARARLSRPGWGADT